MTGRVTLIVCGAPLTARTPDLLLSLSNAGWATSVVGTPASAEWLDQAAITRLTGEPPRLEFRSPGQPKRAANPDAVVVCPATFNTINRAAAGLSDSYALATLCEAIGVGTPTVVVPMVNDKLAGHPAWPNSLAVLEHAGVGFVDVLRGGMGTSPVPSGTGAEVVAAFSPAWVVGALDDLVG